MAEGIEFILEIDKNQVGKEVEKKIAPIFKRATQKSIEYLFGKVFVKVPGIKLRTALQFDLKIKPGLEAEGFIGFPEGSSLEKIGFWTEFGTGERGERSWKQFFDEPKPIFTIPIIAVNSTVLHWEVGGKDIFAKTTKGQKGQKWFRQTVKDELPNIEKIWRSEFSKP